MLDILLIMLFVVCVIILIIGFIMLPQVTLPIVAAAIVSMVYHVIKLEREDKREGEEE